MQNELVLCSCGGRPQVRREYKSYGIITGTKYTYWVQCSKCKKRTKRFSYGEDEKRKCQAIKRWNEYTCTLSHTDYLNNMRNSNNHKRGKHGRNRSNIQNNHA